MLLGRIWSFGVLVAFSQHVFALGLSGLDVQSALGEPLRASVKLTAVTPDVTENCFKLINQDSGLEIPSSMILSRNGENATLMIASSAPMLDPIVNATLVASCQQDVSRDYVILLDPPLYSIAETTTSNTEAVSTATEVVKSAPAAVKKTQKKSKRKKRAEPSQVADSASVPAKVAAESPASASPEPNNGEGRLSISSGGGGLGGLSLELRFARTLSEIANTEATAETEPMSDSDVSDEVTAMSNQLNHLKSEIASLQKRNRELEKKNTFKPKSNNAQQGGVFSGKWPLYLLIGLIAAFALGIAEWMRRRKLRMLDLGEDLTPWVAPKSENASREVDNDFGLDNGSSTTATPAAAFVQQANPIVAEINDDILEQVEVFVAHGRSNLAITLLEEYLHEGPTRSPSVWLSLLDLYKREKLREQYESTATECRRYYNVNIPEFDETPQPDNSRIQDYTNAKNQLDEVWGTPDAMAKLDDLTYNKRKEPRKGFEKNAYLDVLLLRGIVQQRNMDQGLPPPEEFVKPVIIDPETLESSPIPAIEESELPELPEDDSFDLEIPQLEQSADKLEIQPEPDLAPESEPFEAPQLEITQTDDAPEPVPEAPAEPSVQESPAEENTSKIDKSAPLDFKL